LLEEDNQLYVLVAFFILCVGFPMVMISLQSSSNDPNIFDNGIDLRSKDSMNNALFDAIEKNMRKKVKTLSDD
jgi:hypothetical protein